MDSVAECGLRIVVDSVVWLQDGKQFGDEYLAELDLIEVVERHKDNYESDVEDPDDQQSDTRSSSVSDDYVPADRDSDRYIASSVCSRFRVLTSLENLEMSGNFVILENSGKSQGI